MIVVSSAIENGVKRLVDSNRPFWLMLYAEGSRFTKDKHARSEEIAAEKGWSPLEYHLQPRATGFTKVWEQVKEVDFLFIYQIDSYCLEKCGNL